MKLLRFNDGFKYNKESEKQIKLYRDVYRLMNDKELLLLLSNNFTSLCKYANLNIKDWYLSGISELLKKWMSPPYTSGYESIFDFINSKEKVKEIPLFIKYLNSLTKSDFEFIKNWNTFLPCVETLKTKLLELHDIHTLIKWNYSFEIDILMCENEEDSKYINASTLYNISSELKDFESDLGYEINIDFFSGKISIQL